MSSNQRKNLLPPIIEQHIEKLLDTKISQYQREMYCMILERVRDACIESINKYKQEINIKKTARR